MWGEGGVKRAGRNLALNQLSLLACVLVFWFGGLKKREAGLNEASE